MSALLKIDQVGLPAGVAGQARTDGKADGSRVTLTNTGSGSSTVFRLLWTPPDDTNSVATLIPTGDPKVWQFDPSPNVYGSWLIELVQNEGQQTEIRERRVFGVRSFAGFLVPALNEQGDKNASLVLATTAQIEAANNNATDYPARSNEPSSPLNARPWASWWRALHEMFAALEKFSDTLSVSEFMTIAERVAALNGTLASDHQPAIQRAIDKAMYLSARRRVHVPGGYYRTDRPIHIGYGTDFRCVEFVGDGKYDGAGIGTQIRPTFSDAPAICIQGGRSVVVRAMSIFGLNHDHVFDIVFGAADMAHVEAANWVDPSLAANAGSRYAPYAAIAIDPYTGPQPTPHYPDVEYPAFLGAVSQYDKGQSRDTLIEDVFIMGFVVGIVQHPGQADGNGDYTKLSRVAFWLCAYGFSWGNTQSRANEVDHCTWTGCHTCFATTVHGLQIGNPQVTLVGCAFEASIQLFEVMNLGYGIGPTMIGGFAEGLQKIGRCNGVSQNSGSIKFLGTELGFSWWSRYGVPTWVLEMEGSMQVRLENVYFYTSGAGRGYLNFRCTGSAQDSTPAASLAFEGCQTMGEDFNANLYEKSAYNATLGITISQGSTDLDRFSVKTGYIRDLDTGNLLGTGVLYTERARAPRNLCAPVYAKRLKSVDGNHDPGVRVAWQTFAFSIPIVVSTVGRIVTVDINYLTTHSLQHFGGDVGDVMVSDATGAVFAVRSRTGTVIQLEAMSGFDKDGNLLNSIVPGGVLRPINCRRYAIPAVLYGDITAASPTVTNLTLGNGTAPADLSTILTANDYLYVDQDVDQVIDPFTGAAQLLSFDTGARTMTFAGNFNYSQTRRRFAVFVRPAMPNP